jgi:hypothetical protein
VTKKFLTNLELTAEVAGLLSFILMFLLGITPTLAIISLTIWGILAVAMTVRGRKEGLLVGRKWSFAGLASVGVGYALVGLFWLTGGLWLIALSFGVIVGAQLVLAERLWRATAARRTARGGVP